MEISLFEEVGEAVRAMLPDDLGEPHIKWHRRGVKIWFDAAKAGPEHYEAQVVGRHHVDGKPGMAIEIGFHSEHRELEQNEAVLDHLSATEKKWRRRLGPEAETGEFFGSDVWRRVSEAWIEPDIDDPEMSFEIAARLVDYLAAIEPARRTS